MNKKAVLMTALTVLVIGGLAAGGYFYYNNSKFKADTAGQTLAEPAKGMVVQVLTNDGKTSVPNAKLSVLMANVGNSGVRDKFDLSTTTPAGNGSVIVSNADAAASKQLSQTTKTAIVDSVINVWENPLTEAGQKWFGDNKDSISGLAWYTPGEKSYERTSPAEVVHNGKYYYDETYLKTDASGVVNPQWIPIRVYVSFGANNEYMAVKDLIKDGTVGSSANDYLYGIPTEMKNGKLYVNIQLPVSSLLAKETLKADPAVAFKVLDTNNNPVNNASVDMQVTLRAVFHRDKSNRNISVWKTIKISGVTDSNGKVVLTGDEILKNANAQLVDSKYNFRDNGTFYFKPGGQISLNQVYIDYTVAYGQNFVEHKNSTGMILTGDWDKRLSMSYNMNAVNLDKASSASQHVAQVSYLDIDIPGANRVISVATDKSSYLPGDAVTVSVKVGSGDTDLQILRRTMAEVKVSLSNFATSIDAYNYNQTDSNPLGEQGSSTSDIKTTITKGTEKVYTVSFKLPTTATPGQYKVSGSIFGIPYGLNNNVIPASVSILTPTAPTTTPSK